MDDLKDPRGSSLFPHPAAPPLLVGRGEALEVCVESLLGGQRVLIGGVGARPGLGRTAMGAALGDTLNGAFPGGVLWLPHAYGDTALLLARLRLNFGLPIRGVSQNPARDVAEILYEFQPLLIFDDIDPGVLSDLPGDVPIVAMLRGEPEPLVEGDLTLALSSLGDDDCRQLISAALSGADPLHISAAFGLADLMMGHPLGISFALSVVLETGTTDPRGLLSHLRPKLKRLGEFPVERRGVAAVFGLLLNQLTHEDRGLIASLGALPSAGFDLETAAVGLGLTEPLARDALAQSMRLSLLEDIGGGRWRLRNLLGDLARGLGAGEETHKRIATHHLGVVRGGEDARILNAFEGILSSLEWSRRRHHAPLVMGIGRGLMPFELALGMDVGTESRMDWTIEAAKALGHEAVQVEALFSSARHIARGGAAQRPRAQDRLIRTLGVRSQKRWESIEASALLELGESYLKEGRPREALPRFKAALDIELDSEELKGRLHFALGLALTQTGAYLEAERNLRVAAGLLPPGEEKERAEETLETCRQRGLVDDAFAEAEPEAASLPSTPRPPPSASPQQSESPLKESPEDVAGVTGTPGRVVLGPGESFDPLDSKEIEELVGRHRSLLKLAERSRHQVAACRHRESLALLCRAQGDMDGAITLYLESLEGWAEVGDTRAQVNALRCLGRTSAEAGQLDEALYHLLESLELEGSQGGGAGRADTLLGLAEVLVDRGRPDEAERHLDLCHTLFTERKDLRGMAGTLLTRGRASALGGHPQAAEAWVRRALDLSRSLDAIDVEARAQEQLGSLALERGNYDEGLRHLKKSIYLYYDEADLTGVSRALLALGELYRRRGDGAQSFSYLRRVRDLSHRLGLRRVEGACHRALGELALDLEQPVEARRSFESALDLQRRVGDQGELVRILLRLGELDLMEGAVSSAAALSEEAIAIAEASRLDGLLAQGLHSLALCLSEIDDEKAKVLLREAIAIDRRRSDKRGVALGLTLIAQLELSAGKLGPAGQGFISAADALKGIDPEGEAWLRGWAEDIAGGLSRKSPTAQTPA